MYADSFEADFSRGEALMVVTLLVATQSQGSICNDSGERAK